MYNGSRASQISGLQEHSPLHDALAILYCLSRYEQDIQRLASQPAILQNLDQPKLVFDVGAKDLQEGAFGFGFIVTAFDGKNIRVLEKGQFYSTKCAQKVKNYNFC